MIYAPTEYYSISVIFDNMNILCITCNHAHPYRVCNNILFYRHVFELS